MPRKIKIFGLALIAVLALGAVSAQAAFAALEFTGFNTNKKADEALAKVAGTQTTELEYTFSAGAPAVKCKTAGFSGSAVASSTALMLTPSWGGCTVGTSNNVDVRVNGCEYKFAITKEEAADNYSGTYSIVCPATQKIEFEVRTEAGLRKCLDTIEPQLGIGTVTYVDNTKAAPADFTMKMGVSNLANTTDDNATNCGVNQELHKDGKVAGTTTIQGENANKEGIDFTVVTAGM